MGEERFRRAVRGYDPEQVDAALAARDERVARLEAESERLAQRVMDAERRLEEISGGGSAVGGFAQTPASATGALSRKLEEIHAQARGQATRMRMKALEDVVQISDRVTELTRLRDELGAKVEELAGKAGIKLGEEERPPVGTEAVQASAPGVYSGDVEVEVGPLADFAQLTGFEDAAAGIDGAAEIKVKGFSGGRARVAMNLSQPVELLRELEEKAPFAFRVRDARRDEVVLDVDEGSGRKAA